MREKGLASGLVEGPNGSPNKGENNNMPGTDDLRRGQRTQHKKSGGIGPLQENKKPSLVHLVGRHTSEKSQANGGNGFRNAY